MFSAGLVSHFPWTPYCEHTVTFLTSLWQHYSVISPVQTYNNHTPIDGCLVCFHTVIVYPSIVHTTSRSIRKAFVNTWQGWWSYINTWRRHNWEARVSCLSSVVLGRKPKLCAPSLCPFAEQCSQITVLMKLPHCLYLKDCLISHSFPLNSLVVFVLFAGAGDQTHDFTWA